MKLPNALFIFANAHDLPNELNGRVSHITINFPWGSLLESLLNGDSMLMHSLELISRSTTMNLGSEYDDYKVYIEVRTTLL